MNMQGTGCIIYMYNEYAGYSVYNICPALPISARLGNFSHLHTHNFTNNFRNNSREKEKEREEGKREKKYTHKKGYQT